MHEPTALLKIPYAYMFSYETVFFLYDYSGISTAPTHEEPV